MDQKESRKRFKRGRTHLMQSASSMIRCFEENEGFARTQIREVSEVVKLDLKDGEGNLILPVGYAVREAIGSIAMATDLAQCAEQLWRGGGRRVAALYRDVARLRKRLTNCMAHKEEEIALAHDALYQEKAESLLNQGGEDTLFQYCCYYRELVAIASFCSPSTKGRKEANKFSRDYGDLLSKRAAELTPLGRSELEKKLRYYRRSNLLFSWLSPTGWLPKERYPTLFFRAMSPLEQLARA